MGTVNVPANQMDTLCRRWREHANLKRGCLTDGPVVTIAGVEVTIQVHWDEDDDQMHLEIEIITGDSEIKSGDGFTPLSVVIDGVEGYEQTG